MNINITLGIILLSILIVCLWNSNIMEGVANPASTPKEKLEKANKEIIASTELFKNNMADATKFGGEKIIQQLKTNLIKFSEKMILFSLSNLASTPNGWEKIFTNKDILNVLNVYTGLRSMPSTQFSSA